MANRTDDRKWFRRGNPLTTYQKGRRWAFWTVVATGAFSAFSNVRSGKIEAEPIAYSVFPLFALFLAIHLIGYLNPKTKFRKGLVYVGLGITALVAFGMSGFHIYEQASRNGQPFLIALFYPFVVDFPSMIAAVVLTKKDVSLPNRTNGAKTEQAPAKVPTAAKATKAAVPAKTTPARANGTSKTSLAKTTTPAKTVKPKETTTMFMAPVIDTEVVN